MASAFSMLFAKISAVLAWFGGLWVAIFAACWNMVTDSFCWLLDKLLAIAVSAVQSLDVSGITTNLSVWGSLPSDVLNILALLGVGQAVAIISAAIGVRLVLQLIPFVRLGS